MVNNMNNDELLVNQLIKLVEGNINYDEWLSWWTENEKKIKSSISPGWFLKLKPKLSQGKEGSMLICVNNAKKYLEHLGVEIKANTNYIENLKRNWINTMESNQENMFSNNIEFNDFSCLEKNYPNLFQTLKKANTQQSIYLEKNTSGIVHLPNLLYLPTEVAVFFQCVSRLELEGVYFSVSRIINYVKDDYTKIGELWLTNDGDEVWIKNEQSKIYLRSLSSKELFLIADNFKVFLEQNLANFIKNNN